MFNVKLIYKEELWQQIYDRFSHYNRIPTENNKRQAFIPQNSIAIPNPVGTAPAFYVELGVKTIISLRRPVNGISDEPFCSGLPQKTL